MTIKKYGTVLTLSAVLDIDLSPPIQLLIQNEVPDREPKDSIPAFIPDLSVPAAPVPEGKRLVCLTLIWST